MLKVLTGGTSIMRSADTFHLLMMRWEIQLTSNLFCVCEFFYVLVMEDKKNKGISDANLSLSNLRTVINLPFVLIYGNEKGLVCPIEHRTRALAIPGISLAAVV